MHLALAEELHNARLARETVPTIASRYADLTRADAYQVQAEGIKMRRDDGEKLVGGKLGFTSKAMQRAMGVPSPNYGWLTDAMVRDNSVALSDLIHPKVEPEIMFTLRQDLLDPQTTTDDVIAATESVSVCLEVVDSRFDNFTFGPLDNIADNSSAGQLVFGDPVPAGDFPLDLVGVLVTVDGQVTATAAGAAALDHPAAAVAWMAREVAASGRPLQAGDMVISGGLTAPVDLAAGMNVTVEIDRIGSLSITVQ